MVDGARGGLAKDGRDIHRAHALDHVRARARQQRRVDAGTVLACGQRHGLDVRPGALELRDAIEAVELGHAQIEQHQIGVATLHQRQQLLAAARLADYFDAFALFERAADALQHKRMVIRDENLQRAFHVVFTLLLERARPPTHPVERT